MTKLKKIGSWDLFRSLTDYKKFESRLDKWIKASLLFNAELIIKEIRMGIKNQEFVENHPLTLKLKIKEKALIDKGFLWLSISRELVDKETVFIGVLRKKVKADKDINIAFILHEGTKIKITEKMRKKVNYLLTSSGMKPLKPSTSFLSIPGRPFISTVFEDILIKKKIVENWKIGCHNAIWDDSTRFVS